MADAGKKGKLTKAEKEKLKKEELERKAQEEAFRNYTQNASERASTIEIPMFQSESARLQAAEEAKVRKKEEEIMAVEKVKLENEERRVRRADMSELQELLNSKYSKLRKLHDDRREKTKWARYMRCDGSPDPTIQGEINTYINLRLEDQSRNDSDSVLKDSLMDLDLMSELQYIMDDTPPENLLEKDKFLYNETISELQKLISVKLDLGSLQILCDATVLADPETGNLQHVVQNDHIFLGIWGNIMKNPRIKSFEFPTVHFTFDIPRVLGLMDCAVRLMITKYDHFSPTSKSIIPRAKKAATEAATDLPVTEETKVEEEAAQDTSDKLEVRVGSPEDVSSIDNIGLHPMISDTEEPREETEVEVQEILEEDYADPPTPVPLDYEDFDEEDDIVDLRAYDVVGGVYQFNLLNLPPQPKNAGSWTITQLVDPPQIQYLEYIADTSEEAKKDAKDKDTKKDEKPLIGINMILPENCMFFETPVVARWDYDRKLWSTAGFSDLNFVEVTRNFNFKTTHFGTFCLLQDTHMNMPFQSWNLRPHGVNRAVLTITAAIIEIEIEMKDSLCCLSQPKDKPELESIRDKWVTPQELVKIMKAAGVNVFPNEDSSKFVSIQGKFVEKIFHKHPLIEERMYQQMALTASALAYNWSKWNGERSKDEIVFQVAEALEDEPVLEDYWSVFLATKRRVTKLKLTEFDEAFKMPTEEERLEISANYDTSLSIDNGSIGARLSTSRRSKNPSPNSSVLNIPGSKSKVARNMSYSRRPSRLESGHSSTAKLRKLKKTKKDAPVDMFLKQFDINNSTFKSNMYHLMPEFTSKEALERVQETSDQFMDCVNQLLKATRVLVFS
ncbi:dynein axonemal intermediate chain 7 homolog isoform X3 [Physella acuta]|uniref:dynein axonemal intermediate chain 7 homolog isoform X3 n=1 Tax=Physella acuta TaxID=109671 RepID=UPI0027DE6414|nr:dynein axonemal intermediate chain 7 homolog isoform X3 [Physella acuta]XP_059174169.1 dynein axonemal intermediate chain 7 homolog isoform X3 [Physella acuta]